MSAAVTVFTYGDQDPERAERLGAYLRPVPEGRPLIGWVGPVPEAAERLVDEISAIQTSLPEIGRAHV